MLWCIGIPQDGSSLVIHFKLEYLLHQLKLNKVSKFISLTYFCSSHHYYSRQHIIFDALKEQSIFIEIFQIEINLICYH